MTHDTSQMLAIKKDFLERKSKYLGIFKNQWTVLGANSAITSYNENGESTFMLNLKKCTNVQQFTTTTNKKKANNFAIYKNTKVIVEFRARDEYTRDLWMTCIAQCIQGSLEKQSNKTNGMMAQLPQLPWSECKSSNTNTNVNNYNNTGGHEHENNETKSDETSNVNETIANNMANEMIVSVDEDPTARALDDNDDDDNLCQHLSLHQQLIQQRYLCFEAGVESQQLVTHLQSGPTIVDGFLRQILIGKRSQSQSKSQSTSVLFSNGVPPNVAQLCWRFYVLFYDVENYVLVQSGGNPWSCCLLERKCCVLSEFINNISSERSNLMVEVRQVPGETLEHVVKYMAHHQGIAPGSLPCPVRSIHMSQIVSDKWDATFIDAFEKKTIFEIILAANYLDIKCLLHLGCAKIATLIKQMDQTEINRIIEEEEKYRRMKALK